MNLAAIIRVIYYETQSKRWYETGAWESAAMQQDDKRELRRLKREIKRRGNHHVRREAKRALQENPEEAAELELNYGRYSSASLNGLDRRPVTDAQDETTP